MSTLGVDITQEQFPIGGQRKASETFCDYELLRMAFQELKLSFHEKVQKIWELVEDSMILDGVSYRDFKQGGTRPRRGARKQVFRKKRYHRWEQHGKLNDHICPTCGSMKGQGQVATDSSSVLSSDLDVEDSRSDNVQKVSDQSGVQKPVNNGVLHQGIIIEEKRIDKPNYTLPAHARWSAKSKSDFPRIRRNCGTQGSIKHNKHKNRKAHALRRADSKSLPREKNEDIRGQTNEADQKYGLALYVSPMLRAMTVPQQWSDDLVDIRDESYSDDSTSLDLLQSGDKINPVTPNSSPEAWVNQITRDPWATYSSSSSLRAYLKDFDVHSTRGSKPSEPREKPIGRSEYRSNIELRKPNGFSLGACKSLEQSRVHSVPRLEGKVIRVPRTGVSYRTGGKRKGIPKENLSLPDSMLRLNSGKNTLDWSPTGRTISDFLAQESGDEDDSIVSAQL